MNLVNFVDTELCTQMLGFGAMCGIGVICLWFVIIVSDIFFWLIGDNQSQSNHSKE